MDCEEEALEKWIADESRCMAAERYFFGNKVVLRRNAVRYIVYGLKKSKSQSFEAVIPYLAMTFFDRFISNHNLPIILKNEQDNLCLLAFSCLSIAWKMNDGTFKVSQLLDDMGETFSRKKIQAMEIRILKALNWRVHAVTAFFFLDYLARSRVFPDKTGGLKRQCVNRIVIRSQEDIHFTRFKPSIIAACALITATSILNDSQFSAVVEKLLNCPYLKNDEILCCMDELSSMCRKKEMMIELWNYSNPRSEERAGSSPESMAEESSSTTFNRRPGKEPIVEPDFEITSQIEEIEIVSEYKHTSEVEFLVLKYEFFQWENDDNDEDLTAGLQRRREKRRQPRCSFKFLKRAITLRSKRGV